MSKKMVLSVVSMFVLAALWLGCRSDQPLSPVTPTGPAEDPGITTFNWAVGPVEGLTTVWHPAPDEIAVPVGTTVRLRCGASSAATVTWTGAQEARRDEKSSIAEHRFAAAGRYEIDVTVSNPATRRHRKDGDLQTTSAAHTCVVHVVDIDPGDIKITETTPTVSPLGLDEDSSNEETMAAFFAGGVRYQVVSQLQRIRENYYRTAVQRRVTLSSKIDPPVFSSLIEHRIPGERPWLGTTVTHNFDRVGKHEVSVGPPASPRRVTIETYRTVITTAETPKTVPEGATVTFTARTEPPGYEDEITWISSTKYGTATPVTGTGAAFTVTFMRTGGPHPDDPKANWRWLGVRADNATLNIDSKGRTGGMCTIASFEYVGRPTGDFSNGALYFEARPCGSLPMFAPGPALATTRPINGATVQHYPVTGNDLQQACQNIFNTSGPMDDHDNRRHAGSTVLRWTPKWSETVNGDGTSTIHFDTLTYTITVHLPSWEPQTPQDSTVWDSLMTELEKHEQGHVDRYTAGMTALRTALVCTNFTVQSSVSTAHIDSVATATGQATQAFQDMQTSNQNYDAPHDAQNNPTGTNHGTENGQAASWPP